MILKLLGYGAPVKSGSACVREITGASLRFSNLMFNQLMGRALEQPELKTLSAFQKLRGEILDEIAET